MSPRPKRGKRWVKQTLLSSIRDLHGYILFNPIAQPQTFPAAKTDSRGQGPRRTPRRPQNCGVWTHRGTHVARGCLDIGLVHCGNAGHFAPHGDVRGHSKIFSRLLHRWTIPPCGRSQDPERGAPDTDGQLLSCKGRPAYSCVPVDLISPHAGLTSRVLTRAALGLHSPPQSQQARFCLGLFSREPSIRK